MTETAAPAPTSIVFGTDGWRARVAEDFTFENVRRCADGRRPVRRGARRPGEGRRRRLRPPVRVGALRAGRRRGPAGARHPGRHRPGRGADPDELVRGRPARRGRGHRDHGLAQPVDRQRVQGQVADRRRGRRGHAAHDRGGDRGQRRPADRAPAVRGRGGGRPRRVVRPVRRLPRVHRPDPRPRGAPGRRRLGARRAAVRRGLRLDPQAAGRRAHPGHRDPRRAQPVLRRRQPRADPAQRRRGAGPDRRRRLRPRAAARRRRRSGRRGRRARDVPPPARGHRAAHVLPRGAPGDARPGRRVGQQHLDGGDARDATTGSRPTRCRSASSSSARR